MADALHEFLTHRAREDYRDLDLLHTLTSEGMQIYALHGPILDRIFAYAHANGFLADHPEYTPPDEIADFFVHRNTLEMAGAFGLTMAGEACKAIERTNPDLIRRMPDFPWATLKRLRNHYTHPAQYLHNPQLQQLENEAIEKYIKKYEQFIDTKHVPLDEITMPMQTDAEEALLLGITVHKAMRILATSQQQDDLIPLQGTASVKHACTMLGESPEEMETILPLLVTVYSSYILVHEINDTIGRVSCFYRSDPDSGLGNVDIRDLIAFRNRMAHFAGSLRVTDWAKLPEGMESHFSSIGRLHTALGKFPDPQNTAEVEHYIDALAKQYETTLLGKAASEPAKYEALNQVVQDIEYADMSAHVKNAYIQASALLIQRLPAERAQQFLEYVFSGSGDDLSEPKGLRMPNDAPSLCATTFAILSTM